MLASIEALIFSSPEPVGVVEMLPALRAIHGEDLSIQAVEVAIEALQARYANADTALEVVQMAGGYQFLTKAAYKPVVQQHLQYQARRKLTPSALETLAIIAYRQPVTKAEIETVRGVSADYTLLKLLERNLVAIAGRKDAPGRPVLYQTTARFLEHLGLASLRDLPPLRDPALITGLGTDAEDQLLIGEGSPNPDIDNQEA